MRDAGGQPDRGARARASCTAPASSGDALRLFGTGLLGAYTTFSTWMLESHRLGEDGRLRLGWANVLVSLALGLACVWLGDQIGGAL